MARLFKWLFRLTLVVFGVSFLVALVSAGAAAVARATMRSSGDETSDEVALAAIYNGVDLTSRATAFRGGSILAWFGWLSLDLRDAHLDPAGARMTARAAWGGADIIVPEGWRVDLQGTALFGGVGSTVPNDSLPADAPHLEVRAFALFGGVGVSSRPADD